MAIIISGKEYYIVSQLTNHSVMYRQLCERKPIKDKIIIVQERKLIEKNIFDRYVYLENNMVMETTICYQTNVQNDGKIVKILRNNYDYEIEDGIYYYSKDLFQDIHWIKDILPKDNIVPVLDLVSYFNKKHELHKDRLCITCGQIIFLYKRTNFLEYNGLLCVKQEKMDYFKDFESRIKNSTFMDFFDNYFYGADKFPETMQYIRKFYIKKMNDSMAVNREAVAKQNIILFHRFYKYLKKEIFYYNVKEIQKLMERFATNRNIIQFIDFVRQENENFLKEYIELRMKANNQKADYQDIIYSADKFAEIYEAAIDVNIHLKKAKQDDVYAQYWLSILLLLTNFIRQGDILQTPILELPLQYNMEKVDKITLKDAEIICHFFTVTAKNIRINKNNGKKTIHILQDQMPALASAIILCNEWAKKRKRYKMFSIKSLNSERIYNKLGYPFTDIKNRKMNYTLATYFEETGENGARYRSEVYQLLSYMRGHKQKNALTPSETTLIYIKSNNKDTSVTNIGYHTSVRGAFGWMYHLLLAYTGDELTIENETERILDLQQKYNPNEIEKISEYLLNEKQIRKEVLGRVSKFSKGQIKEFLFSIGNASTFKLYKELPCIYNKYCPKKTKNCIYCEYSIKTTHSMLLYRDELYKLIDSLQNTTNVAVIQKNMYLLFKILMIIKDFKDEFDDYDKDYINAFIDMQYIKTKLDALPVSYSNMLGDVLNNGKSIKTTDSD